MLEEWIVWLVASLFVVAMKRCIFMLIFFEHGVLPWFLFKRNLVSFCTSIYKLKRFERYLVSLFQNMRRFLSHRVYLYLWEARERETGGYFSRVRFYEIKVKASKYLLNEAFSKIYIIPWYFCVGNKQTHRLACKRYKVPFKRINGTIIYLTSSSQGKQFVTWAFLRIVKSNEDVYRFVTELPRHPVYVYAW